MNLELVIALVLLGLVVFTALCCWNPAGSDWHDKISDWNEWEK